MTDDYKRPPGMKPPWQIIGWECYLKRAARHCGEPLVFCEKCQAIHEEPACDTKRLPSSE